MSREEEIKAIAKDICLVKLNCNDVCNPLPCCTALKYAERIYDRKSINEKETIKNAINEFAEMLRSHYPHSNSVLKRIDCVEKEILEKLLK